MTSLEARPLLGTGSASSSDFVLLTTDPSTRLVSTESSSIPLAPPRFRFVLQVAAVLDFAFVVGYGSAVPLDKSPLSGVVINAARSVVVLAAVSSRRVREHGPVLLVQLIVSALVLLYRFNELIQTSSSVTSTHRALWNRTSIWYGASFAWSVVHYVLFVVFVGVGRARNPFIERPRAHGTRTSSRRRRRSTWNEHRWEGRQETVPATTTTTTRGDRLSVRSHSSRGDVVEEEERVQGEHAQEGFFSSDDDDDDEEDGQLAGNDSFDSESSDEESEDDDELIDIPNPGHSTATLRNRTSRASLLSLPSPPVSRDNALQASRNYGSMRSLSGV